MRWPYIHLKTWKKVVRLLQQQKRLRILLLFLLFWDYKNLCGGLLHETTHSCRVGWGVDYGGSSQEHVWAEEPSFRETPSHWREPRHGITLSTWMRQHQPGIWSHKQTSELISPLSLFVTEEGGKKKGLRAFAHHQNPILEAMKIICCFFVQTTYSLTCAQYHAKWGFFFFKVGHSQVSEWLGKDYATHWGKQRTSWIKT